MDKQRFHPLSEDQAFWLGRAVQASQESTPTRYSLRRSLPVRAFVNYGLSYSMPSHVRDLSLTGAYLQMETPHLAPGTRVELVLRYRYKDEEMEQRIAALVARVERDGAALVFEDYDDQTYTDLANLLYAM